ncbi:MAG: helix-turn-helix domain-containing protein [Oceanospirillales bacterium]|nr:XRE family transcriptional regulator [Marinobacterium halophilum]MBR9827556.1 helix-turn-helix domain-containing protein [Oceanospirillales bacterium]
MTTESQSPKPHPLIDRVLVGTRLRVHRKQQNLTLKQLSEQCGVALSTLSKMELGQATVSYDKLAAAARVLNISLSQLFNSDASLEQPAQPTVISNTISEVAGYATGSYEYHPIAGEFPGRTMMPLYARIKARSMSEFDEFVRHPGQEFTMVLSGRIRIHFETGEEISLGERETAYFNSEIGHIYLAEGEKDAEVIAVMSEPKENQPPG